MPKAAATFLSSVTATDASGHSGSTTFTWTVNPMQTSVTCDNPGNPTNTVGDAVSLQITCTDSAGLALTYSDNGTLPPGLAIDPASDLITGTLRPGPTQ
jgi:hypothetical protein